MRGHNIWPLAALAAALVMLPGCSSASAVAGGPDAARLVSVAGSDRPQVLLTDIAAARLGIKTDQVKAAVAPMLSIPVTALLYDKNGATWVYVSPSPLTYQRQPVTVARIAGNTAPLQSGPAVGTAVVTVGAAELLGAEFGVAGGQ